MMKKRIAAGLAALLMTFAASPMPELAQYLPLAAPITAQAANVSVYSGDGKINATLNTVNMTVTLRPLSAYYSGMTSGTSYSFDLTAYKTELFNALKAQNSSVSLDKCKVIIMPPTATYFSTNFPNLESVDFNDGFINEVGTSMFAGCKKLKHATFGSSITSIGQNAFANVSSFVGNSSSTLQLNNVTEIASGAFTGCSFKSIDFNGKVKTIGSAAFGNCRSLTSLSFPASLTLIDMSAFTGCSLMTSVKFADNTNISLIGQNAFSSNAALKTIDFGKGTKVKSINTGAFQKNTALQQVIADGNTSVNSLPGGLYYMGVDVFNGDTALKSMNIPSTLKRLPNRAFSGCTGLTTVWFGNRSGTDSSCEVIGSSAFYGCTSLSSVILPASVTSIGSNAFQNCSALEKLVVSDDLKYIDGNTVFTDNVESFAHNRIEDTSTSDAYDYSSGNTFSGCTKLAILPRADMNSAESSWSSYQNKIKLPSSVECIPAGCFQNDTGITAVTAGNLKAVSQNAFNGCTSLETITPIGTEPIAKTLCFPSSCTNIQANAFYKDLKFKYIKIIGKGTATLDSNGTSKYSGNLVKLLTFGDPIITTELSTCTMTLSGTSFEYTGSAIKPTVTIKNGSTTLVSGTDYTVTYSKNTTPGTATVTATGKGKYAGTISKNFTITAKKLSACTMTLSGENFAYTGSAIKPTVTIKSGSTTLVNGTDYTVSYSNNVNTGTATVTATGKGNYTGTLSKNFTISTNTVNLSACTMTLSGTSFEYTGSAIKPTVTIKSGSTTLVNGTDYTLSYSKNTTPGTATVTATGKGKYAGTISKNFTITAKKLSACTMTLSGENFAYTGSAIKPTVTIKNGSTTLVSGTDYTVTYSNNVNTGTATVTATGKGNYTGTLSKNFTISVNTVNLSTCTMTLSGTSFEYTGSAIKPTVTIKNGSATLVSGTDYTVSYSKNTTPGTATVTATGKGKYAGTISKNFTITAKKLSACTMTLSGENFAYTGSAIKPTVTIKNGSATLVSGTDYTVSYSNNINTGTATVTATGKGNYTGTLSKNFTISTNTVNLSTCTMTLSGTSFEYTGSEIKPTVTIKNGSTTLVNGTDYTLSYSKNTTPGTATVTATGKGKYTGTISKNFTITAKKLSACTMTLSGENFAYTGSAIKPTVTIKNGSTTLVNGTDYTVTYSNNVNTGTATVTATGKGNYTGTLSKNFTISTNTVNLSTCTMTLSGTSFEYTGSAIKPTVTIKNGSTTLVSGTDYTVTYSKNTTPGTATVTATGKGKYAGTISKNFTINAKNISGNINITLSGDSFEYTGYVIKPSVTVTSGSTTLVSGTDYSLTYVNNTEVGTATVTATGKGKYTGSVSRNFTITPRDISKAGMSLSGTSFEYTAEDIQPSVTVKDGGTMLVNGTDYTVSYSNCRNVGTASVTVYGIGKYTGSLTKTYTISPRNMRNCTITLSADTFEYSGAAIQPAVAIRNGSVTLVNGTDYTLEYSNNVKTGTATVTATGRGSYTGTLSKNFTIGIKNISSCTMSLSGTSFDYTGAAITPSVTVKNGGTVLESGTDYTISYTDNKEVGTATVTATGKGKFGGTLTQTFTIEPLRITDAAMTVSGTAFEYTGAEIKPAVTVKYGNTTLVNGTDYTISYSNNVRVGTASVTAVGIGRYSGSFSKEFSIREKSISSSKMTLAASSIEYTGSTIEPEVKITIGSTTLHEGIDFTLTYTNNTEPGIAKVTATGIGNYTGSLFKEYSITPSADYVPSFTLGDVNGDGKINVADVTKLAAHVKGLKKIPDELLPAADVNGDGRLTVTDISKLAAHVKGIRSIY